MEAKQNQFEWKLRDQIRDSSKFRGNPSKQSSVQSSWASGDLQEVRELMLKPDVSAVICG